MPLNKRTVHDVIEQLVHQIHQNAVAKGFWLDERNGEHELQGTDKIPEKLMLIVSELSEALEDHRDGLPLQVIDYDGNTEKPVGFAVELADVIIRTLDLCGRFDIPVAEAMHQKMAYNETRLHKHGKQY